MESASKNKYVPLFEMIDKELAKECNAAISRYRSGEDEVFVSFGALQLRLYDRKDNDDRETVRMTMDELLNCIRMCHINGATMAASTIANGVATLAGLKCVDGDGDESDEAPLG